MKTLSVWLGGWVLGWGLWLAAPVQAESWQKLSVSPCGEAPAPFPDYTPGTTFNDVAVPSANTVYVAGGGAIIGGPGVICKSTDRGETWTPLALPDELEEEPVYGIDCFNDAVCYAVASGPAPATCAILKTTNGGVTFSLTSIADCLNLSDVRIVPGTGGNTVVAVGNYGGPKIVRTNNGGFTWESPSLPPGSTLHKIHFADSSVGWAVGSGSTAFKSDDGGASWEAADVPEPLCDNLVNVHFLDPSKIWVTGCIDIVGSEDAGESWGPRVIIAPGVVRDGMSFGNQLFSDSFFVSDETGWAVGGAGGGLIRKTLDGGITWPNLWPLTTNPDTLSETERAVFEDISIYDGDTLLTSLSHLKDIDFYSPNLGFIVGQGQTVLRRFVNRPDLVPQGGWSFACASGSNYLHIIVGIRNTGVGDVTVPFTVRLEGLTGPGGDVVAGAVQDVNVTEPIAAEAFYSVDNFGMGVSPSALYDVFSPAITPDGMLTVRITVDANNNVTEGPEGEENNVHEQTTACGAAPAPEGVSPPPGEEPPSPFPPAREDRRMEKEKKAPKKFFRKKPRSKWRK